MSDPAARLSAILGPEGLVPDAGIGTWEMAGDGPLAVALPATATQVADILRTATEAGWRVVPTGAGTSLRGRPPAERPTVVLSTRRMNDVLAYEPADLTLSVGAGTALGVLSRRLETEGQWIPLDPPGTARRSVGGVLAAGVPGPLWTAFGAPRDHVLGLTAVTGDGQVLKLGGRVVKNVAGFDLVRLMVGSRGTLGVITSANLRLFPRPRVDRALVWPGDSAETLLRVARAVATASVLPAAAEVLDPASEALDGVPAALVVRLMGAAEAVEADAGTLRREVGVDFETVDGAKAREIFRSMADHGSIGTVTARITGLPGNTERSLGLAREWLLWAEDVAAAAGMAPADAPVDPGAFRANVRVSPALGSVHMALPGVRDVVTGARPQWAPGIREASAELRTRARAQGGDLTLVSGPAAMWAAARPVVPEKPGGAADLSRRIVREFDPAGVLSDDDGAADVEV